MILCVIINFNLKSLRSKSLKQFHLHNNAIIMIDPIITLEIQRILSVEYLDTILYILKQIVNTYKIAFAMHVHYKLDVPAVNMRYYYFYYYYC